MKKKYIRRFFRNTTINIISFLIALGGIFLVYAATSITYPSSAPSGETAGGLFMSYFTNLKGTSDCPSGQAVIGFNTNYTKRCGSVLSAVNGTCNNTVQNGCTAGVANDGAIADTTTEWRWRCDGQNGGTNSTTCSKTKPINGTCNNTVQNGCTAGVANDGIVADTTTEWRWRCDGQNGGTNSTTCSKAKPINGVCNNSVRGLCTSGTSSWTNNTSACGTTATWVCVGSNGGTNSNTCSYYNGACAPVAVNGTCNNAVQNGCSTGVANDGAIADTTTEWRWRCDGQNGGANSTTCSKTKPTTGNIVTRNYTVCGDGAATITFAGNGTVTVTDYDDSGYLGQWQCTNALPPSFTTTYNWGTGITGTFYINVTCTTRHTPISPNPSGWVPISGYAITCNNRSYLAGYGCDCTYQISSTPSSAGATYGQGTIQFDASAAGG